MKPSININTSKNGIEITFPQKPTDGQLSVLNGNGFRFHKVYKYWYAVISDKIIDAATEIVGAPVHTTCDASVNLIQRFISSLGKEVKPDVPQALKKDVVDVLNAGTTNLKKELEAINGLLGKMIELAKKHKVIVPNMGDKALLAQLTHLTKPLKVDTKNGQFALFGIEKKASTPVAEEALYGIDFTDEPFDEGLNGSGLTPYDVITNMLLEKIEKGDLSWRKSWSIGSGGVGRLPASNFVTKKAYTGINALILNFLVDAEHPYWFTFNQIKALGGKLRKGAKYAPVCYYNRIFKLIGTNETITEAQAEKLSREQYLILPFLRYYKAYNASDIEGIDTSYNVPVIKAVEAIKSAEMIVNGMPNRPPINHGGDSAHYQPSTDKVQMPHMADFEKEQEYYGTLFHELVHSTAHKSRIGRSLTGRFGSKDYAFEELIAELGASFLCGEAGILYHTMDNSAAYIKGWAKKLTTIISKDNKFIFKATAQAQKAADFIQALHIEKPKTEDRKPVKKPKVVVAKTKNLNGTKNDNIEEPILYVPEYQNRRPYPNPMPSTPRSFPSSDLNLSDTEEYFEEESGLIGLPNKPNGIYSGADIMQMHFETIPMEGAWANVFQSPAKNMRLTVFGKPKNGKTAMALQLADYLSSFDKVLYVFADQGITKNTQDLIAEWNLQEKSNLDFGSTRDLETVAEWIEAGNYQYIFLDLVNNFPIKAEEMDRFVKQRFPEKGFTLVMEATKSGDFKGEQSWTHITDAIVDVKEFVGYNRGRYGSGEFHVWPEKYPPLKEGSNEQ